MTNKLCVLEISPSGPCENHKQVFENNPLCDFYFITHDDPHPDAIAFRKGKGWASNRNYLAATICREYDYYCFVDWDVILTSKTELGVVEQLIKDLDKCKPAVAMVYDPVNESYYGKPDKEFLHLLCSNNHMKIYHKSLLDWIFPGPVKYGEFWDMCHYNNVLEYPFIGHIVCTTNVWGSGISNDPRSRAASGNSMQVIHNKMLEKIKHPILKKFKNCNEYKHHCVNDINKRTPIILDHNIDDYMSKVSEYFVIKNNRFSI